MPDPRQGASDRAYPNEASIRNGYDYSRIAVDGRVISHTDDSFMARSGNLTAAVEDVVKPLDVRAFGLYYWSDLTSIPTATYPELLKILERKVPSEVVEERRGLWRITWTSPERSSLILRRIAWIDQDTGFSPIEASSSIGQVLCLRASGPSRRSGARRPGAKSPGSGSPRPTAAF